MFCGFLVASILSFANPHLQPPENHVPLDETKVKEIFRADDLKTNSSTKYVQYHTPIADAKAFILANGSTLTEIVLYNTDDDLLQTIQANCPNLTSFSILSKLNRFMDKFTDAGLQAIANFPQLSSFTLHMPISFTLTEAGMQALLTQQTSFQELAILGPMDNTIFGIISQYQNLSSLTLTSYKVNPESLLAFVQSANLQASVTSLSLDLVDKEVSSQFLQGLSLFSKLQELTLAGKWPAQQDSLAKAIVGLTNLRKLNLSGLKVGSTVTQGIASLTNLTDLTLTDCSRLGEKAYHALLSALPNLQTLRLWRCNALNYKHCHLIAKMNLQELVLNGSEGMFNTGLETLCKSKVLQKSLKVFELSNNPSIDNIGFEPLKLLALRTLRVVNCMFFNDTSLRLISQGRLASTLQALELEKVFISDASMVQLANYDKLNTIMLSENDAITDEGVAMLLSLPPLNQRIKKLYLCQVAITKDMIPLFGTLSKLAVLVVGNPLQLDIITDGDAFFTLPNVVRNHARVDLYMVISGPDRPMVSWGQFKSA